MTGHSKFRGRTWESFQKPGVLTPGVFGGRGPCPVLGGPGVRSGGPVGSWSSDRT